MDNLSNPQREAELEEMKKEMSQLTSKMAQIKAYVMGENAKLEADLVDERERNRELERKIAEAKRKNDDLEAQLRTEVRDGKAKIGELEEEITALQSKNSDLETQINDQNTGVRDEKAKIEELEGKIKALQSRNSGFETQIRTQNTEVRDGKAKIGELEGKINALQSKNSDLGTQIQFERIKTVEIAKLQADLATKITELMAQIQLERKNKTAEIAKLQANLRTEVRDGKAKIGELEGKINALQSKNSGLETQLNQTLTFVDRDGWSYLAKTASWYKVIDQYMTFDQAVAYCASRKIHLVSIHSQEENHFVWKLAETFHSDSWFWIGLKRNPNKGNAFEWTDGRAVDFTNWYPGEPASSTHARLRSHDGKWVVWSPTDQRPFICKMSSQFS